MPALTFHATNNLAGTAHQEMSETSPGADATSSPATGWTVSTTAATNASGFDAQTKKAWATDNTQPDGSPVVTAGAGDCLRSTNTYSGTFDTGAWTFHFAAIATAAFGQDGRILYRIIRSVNADLSSPTAVSVGTITNASVVTDLTTAAQQTSFVATPSITGFSVTNAYLGVQLAWQITGAASMTTADVVMRIGTTGTRLITPNFTSSVVPASLLWTPPHYSSIYKR